MIHEKTKVKLVEKLETAGKYKVVITKAVDINDGDAIVLSISTLKTNRSGSIRIFLRTTNGEENVYGHDLLNELLTLLELTKLESENGRISSLEGKHIGLLMDIVENKGYKNIKVISFYHIESKQTAYEFENELEAEKLAEMHDDLRKKYAE